MEYAVPKGVFDILPQDPVPEESWRNSAHWEYVEALMRSLAHAYGFQEIRTPIFERTELFIRGVGETSDIVSKEMYTFEDKGGRSLSLRPEGTASIMRAFVEKKLHQQGSLHKFFYIGPMFRYERPQAGRYRQHHQFGVEAIGIAKPEQDVEVIDLLYTLYNKLGLKDLVVMVNSVGDLPSRTHYAQMLRDYLTPHLDSLSDESKIRFSKNILRILDSKSPEDQKLLVGAPSILDALNEECKAHFQRVQELLDEIGIPYVVNPKLVRGLDYYNKTVFEITSQHLGAQNSLGGGGRYDGLIKSFGGPDLPGCGFGTGIERVLQTMAKQNVPFPNPSHPKLFLIGLGEESQQFCFSLLCKLRHEGIAAEMEIGSKKVQHGLQRAVSLGAEYCLVIGEEELKAQTAQIKNLQTRENQTVKFSEIISYFKNLG